MSGDLVDKRIVSIREEFGKSLLRLGERYPRVVVLDADVAHPARLHHFARKFPDRFFQIGIAEQNMVGIAAGLALAGFIPFAVTFAVFAARRAADQIAISCAYAKTNVKILGTYCGLTTAKTGATHQSVEDLSIMRSMPNMRVIAPADPIEVEQCLFFLAEQPGPFYLRIPRSDSPMLFDSEYRFELGRIVTLKKGSDLCFIGTGIMTALCLEAALTLEARGIQAGVLHAPTIKPLDERAIVDAARETGAIVTAENHSVIGGLGGAVSEILCTCFPTPVETVGIKDRWGTSGSFAGLLEEYALSPRHLVLAAENILRRKHGSLHDGD